MPAVLEAPVTGLRGRQYSEPAKGAADSTLRLATISETDEVPAQSVGSADRIELLVEYANSFGLRPHVNVETGVITGVKILGLASRNGRVYRRGVMTAAAQLYEGVKVNVNHPKGNATTPRDYQDRLGSLRNVRVEEGGLFGDLHFNPHHPIAAQLAWDAEQAPENVGLSHNVQARTSRQEGQTIVEQILRVNSVDLVADPATTQGLFESAGAAAATAADLALAATPADTDSRDLHPVLSASRLQEARQELREQRRRIERFIREARLPAEAASVQFVETLCGLDEAAAQALIQERSQFHHSLTAADNRPKSKGPAPPTTDHGGDIRRWARLVT
jgi:hypothetical protein